MGFRAWGSVLGLRNLRFRVEGLVGHVICDCSGCSPVLNHSSANQCLVILLLSDQARAAAHDMVRLQRLHLVEHVAFHLHDYATAFVSRALTSMAFSKSPRFVSPCASGPGPALQHTK